MSSDLIPTNATMTSLEIAELTGKRHADVLRDIRSLLSKLYDLKDGADLHHKEIQGVRIDRDARGYIAVINLDKDHTLTLLTGYDAKARLKVVRRWQELETTPQLPDFTNPIIAARAWADEAEAKQLAQSKVKELEPKAAFHDRVAQTPDLLTVREAAKVLRTGEKRLFRFLREESLLMASNLPYQDYLNRGLFRVVETPYTDNLGRHRVSAKTCITQKGMVYIQGLQDALTLR